MTVHGLTKKDNSRDVYLLSVVLQSSVTFFPEYAMLIMQWMMLDD